MNCDFADLAFAYGEPPAQGQIKQQVEDFQVEEIMPVECSGEGEHLWVKLRKTSSNTEWVAKQIAMLADVKVQNVGYAGLKDRHAVTTQWFSIHLPGRTDPNLVALEAEGVELLQISRHDRKLRRGALSGNKFTLRIRELEASREDLLQRLQQVKQQGVPNYFGEQRFGRQMDNLARADRMFSGGQKGIKRHQRSLFISAARSWIFNQLLSERIQQRTWNQYVAGDVFQLHGKSACFADDGSTDLSLRIKAGDIHSTGPLWGRGESMSSADCLQLEQEVAQRFAGFAEGLEQVGLKQERRALRLIPNNLEWQFETEDSLLVQFELPAGAYATMVMREIVRVPVT